MRSIHKLTPARPRPPMRWPKELRRWLLRGGVSLVRGTPVALGTLAQRPPVPPFLRAKEPVASSSRRGSRLSATSAHNCALQH
jgi:hypothetical protein